MSAARAVLLLAAGLAACGGEDATEPTEEYPAFSGTWQFRSEIREADVVCIEHGDVVVQHGGGASFSGQATLTMDCFEGISFLSNTTTTHSVTGGAFGPRTDRGSWSVTFAARPGWSYQGEAFVAATGSLIVQGSGQARFDPGNGITVDAPFTWTLCAQFTDPSDFVERGCR